MKNQGTAKVLILIKIILNFIIDKAKISNWQMMIARWKRMIVMIKMMKTMMINEFEDLQENTAESWVRRRF